MIITNAPTEDRLRMPWKECIGIGRAYDILRKDIVDHLTILQQEIGVKYARFHALFHDDMDVVRVNDKGEVVYQWHQIDKIYDTLLSLNIRPFIELNPMPTAFASGTKTMFAYQMNITPAKDWTLWQNLIREFTKHVTDRYGEEEVATWYFEVWNEPNLSGFFSGTKEDYFEMYRHAAKGVKDVSARYRIGGPATSKASWITDLLTFCKNENVPINFISTHLYPQDEYVEYPKREGSPHEIGAFFIDTFRRVKEEVAASHAPDIEIHWTEWNVMSAKADGEVAWVTNYDVDSLFAAATIARYAVTLDDACDSMSYWIVSDVFEESGIPDCPFSATYGLVTIHGIKKPSFNAFKLLSKMKGAILPLDDVAPVNAYCGAIATKTRDRVHALLWYYNPHEEHALPAWEGVIDVSAFDTLEKAVSAKIATDRLGPYERWREMGSPMNMTEYELDLLRDAARLDYAYAPIDAGKGFPFTLRQGEVLYVEFSQHGKSAEGVPRGAKHLIAQWDTQMGEQSK